VGRTGLAALVLTLVSLPAVAQAAPDAEYVIENPAHHWREHDLTWSLEGDPTGGVTPSQAAAAIQAALDTWGAWTDLTFTQVDPCACPAQGDIRVLFDVNPHGNGGVDPAFTTTSYGHAIYPGDDDALGLAGDIHLDNRVAWHVNDGRVPDIRSIVTHESGHALGLRHADANSPGSAAICPPRPSPTRPIMCPLILGAQYALAPDDVAGIQDEHLDYGRPDHLVDGMLRRNVDNRFVGNRIVNTTARGQAVTYRRARNQRAIFLVRFTNGGSTDDAVRIKAPAAPAGFTYRYYSGATGTRPATGITTQGDYEVPLTSGQGITIRVVVTVKAGAVRHRSQGLTIRATSQRDGSRVDVVRPTVKVT
jgi:hypothetical protein